MAGEGSGFVSKAREKGDAGGIVDGTQRS